MGGGRCHRRRAERPWERACGHGSGRNPHGTGPEPWYRCLRGVPTDQRAAALRVRRDRRAEDAIPAGRRRRDRPRVREPRHPVADGGGREARRGGAQSAQPPLLHEQGHPEAAARGGRSLPARVRRRPRLRDRGLLDDRRQGRLLAPDADARRSGRHRARCRARRTRSTSGARSSRARACTTCAWAPTRTSSRTSTRPTSRRGRGRA